MLAKATGGAAKVQQGLCRLGEVDSATAGLLEGSRGKRTRRGGLGMVDHKRSGGSRRRPV
ncbi:hypothetical protein E2562_020600 [Oryza meyeriana var. granulata]|uniref:Uncharacterized protein n=1 Tax=Oryza meyeriana var. granulata TaxID=110450 RepID=A0A6G1DY22_9ORYZ|nr:hypothetical protein E2562_020600 [Oryza meyeriana var. granulata]